MPTLPPYDAAVWQARAGQLEYQRDLLLRFLELQDNAAYTQDTEEMVEYRDVWLRVQELRKSVRAARYEQAATS